MLLLRVAVVQKATEVCMTLAKKGRKYYYNLLQD